MSTGSVSSPVRPMLHVVGIGARTSLGGDLAASAAAARAGLTAFADHPFMVDRSGFPMSVARDDGLGVDLDRDERLARLAAAAADEACALLQRTSTELRPQVMLLLALPATHEAADAADARHIAAVVRQALEGRVRIVGMRESRRGHVAGVEAAQMAAEWLATGFDGHVLLVGVDSWLDALTLEWLDEAELLRARTRPFGFVPGEAAAALLLTSHPAGQHAVLSIDASACAAESEEGLAHEQPRLGRALSAAARAVLAMSVAPDGVHALCADLNGLPERADEVGYSVVRLRDRLRTEFRMVTPAEWFGDVGAATAPLMIALEAAALARGRQGGGTTLLLLQSLQADRGALLISAARGSLAS